MSTNYSELAVKTAIKEGATDVIARFVEGPDYQIRFSNSKIDISNSWDTSLLETFIAIDRKVTQVDIQDPTKIKIEKTVKQATAFAKKMPDSEFYSEMETRKSPYAVINGLFDSKIDNFYEKAPEYVNVAIQNSLESGAKRVAGSLYFGKFKTQLVTSHGTNSSFDSSYYRLTIRSFVDYESSGQDVVCGRNLSGIEKKFAVAGQESGNLAKMAVGGKQGQAGKYDLIMSPIVAANVLGQITDGANPLLMMIGMSPLGDHMGEQISPEFFNVNDNPLVGEGLASSPFDIEGTPTMKTPIIKNGVFVGVVHNTSTAKLMQTKSTGSSNLVGLGTGSKILAPAASNMVYSPGKKTLDEIIKDSIKPTIYVTSNWYTRYTNMLEGEFSTIPRDGMFLIEKGEIKKPIRKLRLTDNLLRMSKNIEAVGKDQKQIQWWEVGTPTFISTIKVRDCNITAATK